MKDRGIAANHPATTWLVVLLAISPVFFSIPITHDAAWQMWIGRQMAHGGNLYSDIVEVNPPLWFWMATPLARLAEVLGIRSLALLVGFFIASIALAIWLAVRVTARSIPIWPLVVAMTFPIQHFGQREHFILIFAIPYVLLIAQRERGKAVPAKYAIPIGFCGAVAFALKPQFAIVPVVLELWAWRAPKIRTETITLGIAALIYVAAVAIFERDYLTDAIPLNLAAYGQFAPMGLASIRPSLFAVCFASPLLLRARHEAAAFTVASLVCFLIYLFQMKGWGYHALPALGTLFVAVALSANGSLLRKALGLAVGILILVPNLKPYRTPPEFRLNVPPGTSFAALSVAPRAAWPMVEERRLKWPLRYFSLWMAPTVEPQIFHDLACNPPELLLVDDRQVDFSSYAAPILRFYSRIDHDGPVKLFRRVATPAKPTSCRTIY
jgi:hypothetical protein